VSCFVDVYTFMTEESANRLANVVLGAAAVGIAYAIWRLPGLRRLAVGLAATAVTSAAPAWLHREVRDAWAASGRDPRSAL
jgi:hypothetical protein